MLVIDLPAQCGFLAAAAIPLQRQRPPADCGGHKLVPEALTCGSTSFFLNMLLIDTVNKPFPSAEVICCGAMFPYFS